MTSPPSFFPTIVWSLNPLSWASDFLDDFWTTLIWVLDWILYGISMSVVSLFLAIQGLVTSIIHLLFDITYPLGPFSAPLFLVLCLGMLGFIGLIFDQIMSWIPK